MNLLKKIPSSVLSGENCVSVDGCLLPVYGLLCLLRWQRHALDFGALAALYLPRGNVRWSAAEGAVPGDTDQADLKNGLTSLEWLKPQRITIKDPSRY